MKQEIQQRFYNFKQFMYLFKNNNTNNIIIGKIVHIFKNILKKIFQKMISMKKSKYPQRANYG
jgi:hypothetical protein